jgi:hypothetical protein
MTYVAICQPPWRYTGTTRGMWSPTAAGILADRASLGEHGMIRSSKVHHAMPLTFRYLIAALAAIR